MRRSYAPSQLNKSKNFVPPFRIEQKQSLSVTNDDFRDGTSNNLQDMSSEKDCLVDITNQDSILSLPVINSKEKTVKALLEKSLSPANNVFHTPKQVGSAASSEKNAAKAKTVVPRKQTFGNPVKANQISPSSFCFEGKASDIATSYYSVVWAKVSKKKHKKWEGDGVLLVNGRHVTLMDCDGKQIAQSTSYPTSELCSVVEGSTLTLGGKEVEIMAPLSAASFTSGQCFTGGASSVGSSQPCLTLKQPSAFKPFSNPTTHQSIQLPSPAPRPRHDPATPNSLVLLDVPKSTVAVVVDPYLSRHLRPHQREGVSFLYECVMGLRSGGGFGAILADEMGLGKTLQTITLIWTLLKQGPFGRPVARRILIATPGSLVKNWAKEFRKWLGNERLSVYAVGPDSKVKDFATINQPVMIVSYEMLLRTIDDLKSVTFDLVVCDEGHRLKNSSIKTSTLIAGLPCQRRVILSGTPIQNDLQEFYALVSLVNPGILGTSSSFHRVYEVPILQSQQPDTDDNLKALGQERAAELNRVTAAFILRRTSQTIHQYLPGKTDVVLFCRPSAAQLLRYQQMLLSCRSVLDSSDTAQHLKCLTQLRQLCNHPQLVKDEKNVTVPRTGPCTEDVQLSGKMSTLNSLLSTIRENCPADRIVVVSTSTRVLDMLEWLCNHHGYTHLRLDGQTSTSKRMDIVDKFNGSHVHYFVFLLSSKAGGVGLNLIGASRLVIYDIDWNPANDLQAMARIWRDGQKQAVVVYRLLTTGTIEEKIYQRQLTKVSLSSCVVDAKSTATRFSKEELRDLFTLEEDTLCATHELLGCECQGQASKRRKLSNKGGQMEELLNWTHESGPDISLDSTDPILSSCNLSCVSFAFWTRTQGGLTTTIESGADN